VLGTGVTVLPGERWYVRPQVRLHVLRELGASGGGLAAGVSVAVGYRF
jgi:hypothetical protein